METLKFERCVYIEKTFSSNYDYLNCTSVYHSSSFEVSFVNSYINAHTEITLYSHTLVLLLFNNTHILRWVILYICTRYFYNNKGKILNQTDALFGVSHASVSKLWFTHESKNHLTIEHPFGDDTNCLILIIMKRK